MLTRRSLLAGAALLPSLAHAARHDPPLGSTSPRSPFAGPTGDDDFWRTIQEEFTLDRSMINLNNGGCSPTPRVVHEAFKRTLDQANQAPAYQLWQLLEPGVETVRRELAREAGCDPEELAITRNASEALQCAQLGLTLQAGDEVILTDQDYPRMQDTWDQRALRDGIVIKRVSFPVPLTDPAVIVETYRAAITPRTRVLHMSHVVFLTGQVLPIQALCTLARERALVSIVDGAHAFAHVPVNLHDIGCDYYGTSLHKWLLAPVGTGFLYVRRERIADHWPLTPANVARKADIRKFEEIGTHPAANHNAIAEALVFHRRIGPARKHARLHALRMRWSDALRTHPKVKLWTPDDPAVSGAIGLFSVAGMEPAALVGPLWDKYRIIATPINHAQFAGVRVTPNVYTTPEEIDTFVGAVQSIVA